MELTSFSQVIGRSQVFFVDLIQSKNITLEHTGDIDTKFPSNLNILSSQIYNNLVSNAIKFSEDGTGFGLPLVKEYVEFLDGTIDAVSHIDGSDRGTIFTLIFNKS